MSASEFIISIYLLSFLPLLKAAFGSDHLSYYCLSPENFTTHDSYEKNLKELTSHLSHETPASGFGHGSRGHGPDQVYGLALCHADISSRDCRRCVVKAGKEVHHHCPFNKGATIWYDKCMFKYWNEDFFGDIDYYSLTLCDRNNARDFESFEGSRTNLLILLARETLRSQKMFATGSLEVDGSRKLHGLTQCSRDISAPDCEICLELAATKISQECEGKQGGRFLGGSCSVEVVGG